jgi:Transglutaminase-like superfamily
LRGARFSLVAELSRVFLEAPRIEYLRRNRSLHFAVRRVRALSRRKTMRDVGARVLLRRAIALVDARFPGGPNCVRRSLLEIALDRGAANEQMFAGIRHGGGSGSGHAWLESHPVSDSYDAVLTIS